jgi:hypothetical protein
MKYRKKLSKRTSRRKFSRTVSPNRMNMKPRPYRGGTRL